MSKSDFAKSGDLSAAHEPSRPTRSWIARAKEISFPLNQRPTTVVAATKWDAVKSSQRVRHLRALAAELEDSERPLLPVSSETGENLPTLGRLLKDRLTGRTRDGAAPAAPQGPTQKES